MIIILLKILIFNLSGLIAMLFGIYDVFLLLTIVSINACMNFFGLLQEVNFDKKGNKFRKKF